MVIFRDTNIRDINIQDINRKRLFHIIDKTLEEIDTDLGSEGKPRLTTEERTTVIKSMLVNINIDKDHFEKLMEYYSNRRTDDVNNK